MFCPNCGHEIVNGAKYCSKCGTKLPEDIKFYADYRKNEGVIEGKGKNTKRHKRAFIIIPIVIVAFGMISVPCVFGKKIRKENNNYKDGINNWIEAENLIRGPQNRENIKEAVSLMLPSTISKYVADTYYSSADNENEMENSFSGNENIESQGAKIELVKINSAKKIDKTILKYYKENEIRNRAWDLVTTHGDDNRSSNTNADLSDRDLENVENQSDNEKNILENDEVKLYTYLLTIKLSDGYSVDFTYSDGGKEKNKSLDLFYVDGLWTNSDVISDITLTSRES